jgi:tRNA-specific 2-thiouridylase
MKQNKVIVAMSGGVDSSVAALLLKEAGYDVIGVTMKLYSLNKADLPTNHQGCCTVDDVDDARRVCQQLGVPHYVFNLQREFQQYVVDYFTAEYQRGRTPHPCIACNDKIKFSFLLERAQALGARYVATGHYARVVPYSGGFRLLKAVESQKDQSYVLFGMCQDQLAHMLMPVGCYSKEQVRHMAEEASLPNAHKPDSQDICFIPWGDYRAFLSQRATAVPGNIVDKHGNLLGEHQGIESFTVGQRRGLGVASQSPMYVVDIDPERGEVVVGPEGELYREGLRTDKANYVGGLFPREPMEITVKIRYMSPEVPATLYPETPGALVRFRQPQRAITPGQAVVFYNGEEVLGGGFIDRAVSMA